MRATHTYFSCFPSGWKLSQCKDCVHWQPALNSIKFQRNHICCTQHSRTSRSQTHTRIQSMDVIQIVSQHISVSAARYKNGAKQRKETTCGFECARVENCFCAAPHVVDLYCICAFYFIKGAYKSNLKVVSCVVAY